MTLTLGAIPFLKSNAAEDDGIVSKSNLVSDSNTGTNAITDPADEPKTLIRGSVEPKNTYDGGSFSSGVQWELDDNGVLTLSGSGELPASAFDDTTKAKIKSVKCASNCQITGIGSGVFSYCANLSSVSINVSNATINGGAFYGCTALQSLTLNGTVSTVYGNAFTNCNSLTSVRFTGSNATITGGAFSGCPALQSLTVDGTVSSIESGAFYYCPNLSSLSLTGNNLSISSGVFSGISTLQSVTLNGTVSSIGSSAFAGCTGLASVSLTGNNATIDYSSFVGCTALQSFTVDGTVSYIGAGAFSNCSKLASVSLIGNGATICGSAFSGCSSLETFNFDGTFSSIVGNAFSGCTKLTSVSLTGSNATIGSGAFSGCKALQTVTVSGTVSSIEGGAFSCPGPTLKNVFFNFPSLQSCNNALFSGCTAVTLHLPCEHFKVGEEVVTADNASQFFGSTTAVDIPELHTRTEDPIPATCTEAGNSGNVVCEGCGKILQTGTVVPAHGHSLTQHSKVNPTCTEEGHSKYWKCSECGKLFSDAKGKKETTKDAVTIPARGHSLTEHPEAAATCTQPGHIQYWSCNRGNCGMLFSDAEGKNVITQEATVIPAHGHSMILHPSVAATCTEDGRVEYWECDRCGNLFDDENGEIQIDITDTILLARGHSLTSHPEAAATCTEPGNIAYWECENCHKYFSDANGDNETSQESIVIPAPGHSLTLHRKVAATCTEAGHKRYWECENCHKYFSDENGETETNEAKINIPALGHSLTLHRKVPATCTEAGHKRYWECENCHKYFSDANGDNETSQESTVIPALGHSLTLHRKVPATCTEAGHKRYWECENCHKYFSDANGETETNEAKINIPATGHRWGEWIVTTPATCKKAGVETRTCENDPSHTKTRRIAALGHDWGEWTVTTPPTCKKPGVLTRTCKNDPSHTKTRTIDPIGHRWGEWIVTTPATCEEAGVETSTCKNDPSHTKTREIDPIGHRWGKWTVTTPATCEEAGVETRTCKNDPSHTKTREIAALGHDWGEWTVTTPATCEETGVETRTCKNDPNHTETREIAALGHDWGEWTGDALQERKCSHDDTHTEKRVNPNLSFGPKSAKDLKYTLGSSKTLKLIIDRLDVEGDKNVYSYFENGGKVVVTGADGYSKTLTKDDCITEDGSLKVTLKVSYLESLESGTYSLTASFVVDKDLAPVVSKPVKFSVAQPVGVPSPGTGESAATTSLCIALLFIAGFGGIYAFSRRRNAKAQASDAE